MASKRPLFQRPRVMQAYSGPEELFGKLPNRSESHGYLRAPQVDALRSYVNHVDDSNIALELPTGTGKTTVGLLIAEWCRRKSGGKAAYLSLTNQLAQQVLEEACRLGVSAADLRGTRETRDRVAEGRYQTGESIGVTTYANLFNVNPVIQVSDVLVFDDAHGGDGFVGSMWTVTISAKEHQDLFVELLTVLRPAISDPQFRSVTNEASAQHSVELVDVVSHSEVLGDLTALLDRCEIASVRFPWSLISENLDACLILASRDSISVRPTLPPTHTHEPFSDSRQRIYMSATLGGKGDLQRAYGVTDLVPIQAQYPQWGHRYMFVPELVLDSEQSWNLVASVWSGLPSQRALILSPSFKAAEAAISNLQKELELSPRVLRARDVEDDLLVFTQAENVVLSLAGRYDGIDLPGDDCRLLVMVETPGAIGPLERHQRTHWKLGPLFRRRERTRLIQGMGRCTRDATDFAVIILMGQSLTDAMTTRSLTQGLPGEIQKELNWGISQSKVADDDTQQLIEMILGLIVDAEYRSTANESFEDIAEPSLISDPESYERGALNEVSFSVALWERDYTRALQIGREAADANSGDELGGYRAWWLFLASMAAHHSDRFPEEIDCLKRARATGVNAGFLDYLIRSRTKASERQHEDADSDAQCEAMWDYLNTLGWHGPRFANELKKVQANLASAEPTLFHTGLEGLGLLLGAHAIRSTDPGAPDVVWIFSDRSITFEAKTDKKSNVLAKRDLLQAKAHPDWSIAKHPDVRDTEIIPTVVSSATDTDTAGKPHTIGVFHASPETINELAQHVATTLRLIRTEFAAREYSQAMPELKALIAREGLLSKDVASKFTQPLAEPM